MIDRDRFTALWMGGATYEEMRRHFGFGRTRLSDEAQRLGLPRPKPLRPIDRKINREKFTRFWLSGATYEEMSQFFKVSHHALHEEAKRLKLPLPKPIRPTTGRTSKNDLEENCPSPAEIEVRAAEVRARWSDDMRGRRRVCKKSGWTPPLATIDG